MAPSFAITSSPNRRVSSPEIFRIDVQDCLERVDELLLATPVRNGHKHEIRLSLSGEKRKPRRDDDTLDTFHDDDLNGDVTDFVFYIPVEIVLKILGYLPPESIGCLRRVCKSWKTLVDTHSKQLFRPLCLKHGWCTPAPTVESPLKKAITEHKSQSFSGQENNTEEKVDWLQIFSSHWSHRTKWTRGEFNTIKGSPWRKQWVAVGFDAEIWGDILDSL